MGSLLSKTNHSPKTSGVVLAPAIHRSTTEASGEVGVSAVQQGTSPVQAPSQPVSGIGGANIVPIETAVVLGGVSCVEGTASNRPADASSSTVSGAVGTITGSAVPAATPIGACSLPASSTVSGAVGTITGLAVPAATPIGACSLPGASHAISGGFGASTGPAGSSALSIGTCPRSGLTFTAPLQSSVASGSAGQPANDLDEFATRFLRLALVVYETSTNALKPVLDDVISTKYPDLQRKSFDEKLETALLRDENLIFNSLLVYERPTVFPSSGCAGLFQDFDIGIVGRLIKFFVGKSIWAKETSGLPDISNLQYIDMTTLSRFASVELLRGYRNWVFHYTGNPPLTEVEFRRHWDQLFTILQLLGYDTSRVSNYRSGPLDYENKLMYEKSKELIKDLHTFKSEMTCKVEALCADMVTKNDLKEEFWKVHAAGHLEVVSDDVKLRAQEACWLVHDRLLKCRELDIYGEQIDGKPKREMMVSLQTLKSKEMDFFRLNQGKEIEHHLQQNFLDMKTIEMHEVFNDDHVVLVRGLPGSGKSTLCHFILREWQAGRLWRDRCYDFIFYVNAPLAQSLLHPGPFSAYRVLKVLYPDIFREIKYDQFHQFKYLIIVDSIDECDVEKICTQTASVSAEDGIKQLITSHEKYDRIVVGRPHACDKVREKLLQNVAFQYVEVVGFSTEQLKLYVDKFCEPDCNKAAVVWQKINDNQSLYQMVHLPVFANIACNILSEDSSVQIEKQTELYVWTYSVFVTRHFKNHPTDVDVSTFEKVFSNEYLLDALAKVSKMAFRNLTSGKIFFQASDFSFSAIELTLLSPFLVQRQQFLSFAHLTLMEFLAAVHLFLSGVEFCNSEILPHMNYMRGVLPMYFGLLGSLVKDSDSAKIIKRFTRPLINKFHIKSIDKHPLCGKVGEMVYRLDKGYPVMFMDLCYEFGNGFLLNDAHVFWDNDAMIFVGDDQRLTRLFFFMNNLRLGRRRIRTLTIIQRERELTIDLCEQLSDLIISCGWKVNQLGLWISSLNEEKMKILAPAFCLVRVADLHLIRASSDECWMILLTSIENAFKKKTLQLEELTWPPNINESILAQMKKLVRYVLT